HRGPHRGAGRAPLGPARGGAPPRSEGRVVRSQGVTQARLATVVLATWALAFWLSEGLLQVVADLSLLVSAVLVLRGATVPRGVRVPVVLALGLAAWQALSPLLVRALGAPGLPPASLWLHCLDTAALSAAALLGAQGVRWIWPERLFLAGGLASLILSGVQHLVRWSIPVPTFLRVPVDRVHETFGGEERYAAGGFFFHRLRLAHASIAALGPALAVALRPADARRRLLAAALGAACLACIVLAYARAALLTAVLLLLVAALVMGRSARHRALVLALPVTVALIATLSPGWQTRLG